MNGGHITGMDCRRSEHLEAELGRLRRQMAELERERDAAVKRAELAEGQRSYWKRAYLRLKNPNLIYLEV